MRRILNTILDISAIVYCSSFLKPLCISISLPPTRAGVHGKTILSAFSYSNVLSEKMLKHYETKPLMYVTQISGQKHENKNSSVDPLLICRTNAEILTKTVGFFQGATTQRGSCKAVSYTHLDVYKRQI